jgi:predicted RNase H-like HicB family nuclease
MKTGGNRAFFMTTGNAPEEVMAALAEVHELLEETLGEFPR